MTWVLALLPLALLALGFPFFVILLATAAVVLVAFAPAPATVMHQVMFSSIDKYALLAVPFFIFAGDLMGRGGVSKRLVRWVTSMIGGVRGSLPFTALGTVTVFSAISGSTAATVAAVGGLTYDRLREAGYNERFSSGLLISAASIDNLIPPSIGFILYGIASDTSVVKLFAAGVIPGLVLAGVLRRLHLVLRLAAPRGCGQALRARRVPCRDPGRHLVDRGPGVRPRRDLRGHLLADRGRGDRVRVRDRRGRAGLRGAQLGRGVPHRFALDVSSRRRCS